ncbi:MAG: GNAT family N-acetyltransferase [Sphingobacteriaceae bacterium]|nr:GNAT family N-acetyltransferase [Cytophagaceae bacterium]
MKHATFLPLPTLQGPTLTLRPLHPDDFEALYQSAADPLVWEQHPSRLRYQRPVFEAYFAGAIASGSALAVIDHQTGQLVGCSRYYDWNEAGREIAIGYTFLARSHWGGTANAELKKLMLDYAFQWVDTVWFHIGPENWRSRRAVEKIGGQYSHQGLHVMPNRTEEVVFYTIRSSRYLEEQKTRSFDSSILINQPKS